MSGRPCIRRLRLASLGAGLPLVLAAAAVAAQEAADTVADTVRDRGFPCERALAVERDPAASRPDEVVWILRCSNGRYRVRYPGDTAPQVEPLA